MDKTHLTNLQAQIDQVQAQIDNAFEEREALKAQYSETLKAVAKQIVEEAVAECGYEIVGPLHDVAKELIEVFPLPPEEVVSGVVVDMPDYETVPFYPQEG